MADRRPKPEEIVAKLRQVEDRTRPLGEAGQHRMIEVALALPPFWVAGASVCGNEMALTMRNNLALLKPPTRLKWNMRLD